MVGIDFTEFLLIFVIGLIVLGPKRLPEVANKLGAWVGKARRMTRVLKRQLEEELDFEDELSARPKIAPPAYVPPNDDDTYSPMHAPAPQTVAGVDVEIDADKDAVSKPEDTPRDDDKVSDDSAAEDDDERRHEA